MSKLKQLFAVAAVVALPFAVSVPASAASTCAIGYTGPNSNNQCTSTTTYTCTVNNETTVTIDQTNDQVAVSGDANNSGNTTGGDSQTGSATNSNGVTFNVQVDNTGDTSVCVTTASVPATPTPTPAPEVQGRGAVAAPAVEKPAVLAATSGDMTATVVAAVLLAGAAGIATLRLVSILQRR